MTREQQEIEYVRRMWDVRKNYSDENWSSFKDTIRAGVWEGLQSDLAAIPPESAQ